MTQFARQTATALKLIAKYGVAVAWYKKGAPVIADAGKPFNQTNSLPVSYSVPVVFLDEGDAFLRYMLGGSVPTGGLYGLFGHVTFEPQLSDYIIVGSDQYDVTEPMRKLAPNLTEDILWVARFAK